MDMDASDQTPSLEHVIQPTDHGPMAGPSISNYNPNVNTHSGTGNLFNYSPTINNVFNATVPQDSNAIQASIAAALRERHVPQAVYSAQLGSGCMDGTRVQVLRDIETWIQDLEAPQIFWLSGMMGTGKSAIAWTACSWARKSSNMILGGTFFCSRSAGTGGQRDVRCIIPTLVQLLARQSPEFAQAVAAELARDPDILHQQVAAQIEQLLYTPLLALQDSTVPIVFVIDALDECGGLSSFDGSSGDAETHRLVSDMLEALVAFSRSPVTLPVKFLVTSRPETHIRDTPVSDAKFNKVLQLHTVNRQQVAADIRLYISTRLSSSSKLRALFTTYDIDTLVRLCDGLFIVATTALEFTLGAGVDRAALRFKKLLNSTGDGLSPGAVVPLDRMYAFILAEAGRVEEMDVDSDDGLPDLLQLLASLLCARSAFSITTLANLLEISAVDIRASLSHLHAVVHVPEEDQEPGLRTLHASFGDYLFGRAPTGTRIIASRGHEILARACLQVMVKRLRFNVTMSRSSYEQNLPRTPDIIEPSLEYACLQWVYHACELPEALFVALDEAINTIFLPRFLFWLEVLSVLRRVSRAAAMLFIATSMVKDTKLSRFLRDGVTFVASSREAIERSAPHIYLSALPFAAKDSLIYRTFFPLCAGLISVETFGIDPHGGRLVMTLTGHERPVSIVAYSPDGRLLASGSSDETVRIWDTRMGEETLAPLRSGDGPVLSVVFAPDGNSLVAGTAKGALCVWSLLKGQVDLHRLLGHTAAITSIAYIPDGSILASASYDQTVRLWRTETGQQLVVCSDHVGPITSVAFSPDGAILASSSAGTFSKYTPDCRAFQLRYGRTGQPMTQQPVLAIGGSSIDKICFSPDGAQIGLGYSDGVRLYEVRTGRFITNLPSKPSWLQAIQFSPDGQSMLVVMNGAGFRVWNLQLIGDVAPEIVLASENQGTQAATFSPDGLHIALASSTGRILILSTGSGRTAVQPLPAHSSSVSSIALAPDGSVLVSGSIDGSVGVWDMRNGRPTLLLLAEHTGGKVSLVAISADGSRIASATREGTILLWDVRTGEAVRNLQLGSGERELLAMAFRVDTRFIGVTRRRQFCWDIATGQTLACHLLPLYTEEVIFSHDGLLAITSYGYHAEVRKTDTWKLLRKVELGAAITSFIGLSSTGGQFVYSGDREVLVWDIHASQKARRFDLFGQRNAATTISPDGPLFYSSLIGRTLLLRDSATGMTIITLHYPSGSPRVVLKPDGQSAVSFSARDQQESEEPVHRKISVWDVTVARVIASRDVIDPETALASATLQDGWLTGPAGELLLWVPEEYRDHLQIPPCTMLINWCRVTVAAGAEGWHRGENWTACWREDTSGLNPNDT